MITEESGGCPGAATTTIKDDVVGTGCECEVDVIFNVLGAEFKADRDASTDYSDSRRTSLPMWSLVSFLCLPSQNGSPPDCLHWHK